MGSTDDEGMKDQHDLGILKGWEECCAFSAQTSRNILAEKRPGIYTAKPDASVFDALRLMAEHNVGALVVVDGGDVVGVISERDYARKVILIGKSSRETKVREIMGTPPVTVGPATTVGECMQLMTGNHIRHLPVVASGVLIGCVSIGDVVKAIIADQRRRIQQLEAYLSDTYPA